MSTIQWFPGHMAKAKREAIEKLKLVDIVVECVDARIPESSRNPLVEEIKGNKKHIMVLNKADLADSQSTSRWINYYRSQGIEAYPLQAKDGKGLATVKTAMKKMMQADFDRLAAKGVLPRPIRLMILGIPNVGKSTFINRIIQKNQAETANKPGVTKGQRWLKIGNDFELLDTPGILWPKFEDALIGKKLAVTGAIKDALLQMDDIALYAIDFFKGSNPEGLKRVYRLTDSDLEMDNPQILMKITSNLGMKDDYDRASERLIYDIRGGKLGTYTLDTPPVSPVISKVEADA